MAERYRDLQRPSMLETGIAQQNAGSASERLAGVFKQFEQVADEYGGVLRAKQGEEEGALEGEEKAKADRKAREAGLEPEGQLMKRGLRTITAYGRAYNNAALRSYTVQAEADADETAARIELQAANNPERFRELFGKVRDEVLKNAEPGLRSTLSEMYSRRLGAGVVRAIEGRAVEVKNENRVVTKQGVQQAVDRIGRLRSQGDKVSAEQEEHKLALLVNAAEIDGTFTPAEAQILRREAQVGILAQHETGSFVQELNKPNSDPLTFIENLRKEYAASDALSSDEENKVIDGLFEEWRQHSAILTVRRAEAVQGHVAAVMDAYSRGQAAGTTALASLPGVPDSLKDAVRGKVLEAVNERRTVAREENVDTLVSIARAEATRTVGDQEYVDTERMYDAGAYTPEQYANQLGALDTARLKKAGDTAVAEEVNNALASGVPLDPSSKAVKKALAAAFDVQTQGLEEGSQEWRSTAMAFAARTRMLPKQAISWAEKMRRSPDAVQVIPAAQFLSSLHEIAPQALEGVDERSLAFSSLVSDSASAGTDPKEAVDMARSIVYETPKELIEQLKVRYRADKLDDTSNAALTAYLDEDFDPGVFSGQPVAPVELQAAFSAQARRYYDITRGDIGKARDLAWKDIKRVAGVSEVNGVKQLMLMPPESFGVTPDMVRADLTEFVKANPPPDGSTAEELIFVPDSATQQDAVNFVNGAASPPSYLIFTKSGAPAYDKAGNKQRYYLPDSKALTEHFEKTRKEAELKEQQTIDNLRKYRDAKRQDEERRRLNPALDLARSLGD